MLVIFLKFVTLKFLLGLIATYLASPESWTLFNKQERKSSHAKQGTWELILTSWSYPPLFPIISATTRKKMKNTCKFLNWISFLLGSLPDRATMILRCHKHLLRMMCKLQLMGNLVKKKETQNYLFNVNRLLSHGLEIKIKHWNI